VFRLKRRRVGWVERGETHPPMTGYHDFSSVRPRHTKAHEVVAGTQPTGLCPPLCSAGLRIENGCGGTGRSGRKDLVSDRDSA
jgi:hypothetical protein